MMEMVFEYPKSHDGLLVKRIRQGWGLRRLFRYLDKKCPYSGESVLLAHILLLAKREGVIFSKNTIRGACRDVVQENLRGIALRWLISLQHDDMYQLEKIIDCRAEAVSKNAPMCILPKRAVMESPLEFGKNGIIYKRLCQEGRVLLYEQSSLEHNVVGYEVMLARIRPEGIQFGKKTKVTLKFPSNEDFGTYGWSYQNLASAQEKFNELVRCHA